MKVAIGITTYNRRHLVETHAKSLCASGLPRDTAVIVIDDASTDYDVEYLKAIYPEFAVIQRRSENSGGASFAIRDLMARLVETGADAVLLLDSDCIVATNFLKTSLDLLQDTDGLLSLFNTPSHPEIGRHGALVLKEHVGSAATLWRSQLAREVLTAVPPGRQFDWRFCDFLIGGGYKICVMRDSLVQHIGFSEGQHCNFVFGDIGVGFSDIDAQNAYRFIERVAFASQSRFRLMQAQIDEMLQRERKSLETGHASSHNGASTEPKLLGRIGGYMRHLLQAIYRNNAPAEQKLHDRIDGSTRHLLAEDIVSGFYRRILFREPDDDGYVAGVSGLRTGTLDIDGLLLSLLKSDEFKSKLQTFMSVYGSGTTAQMGASSQSQTTATTDRALPGPHQMARTED